MAEVFRSGLLERYRRLIDIARDLASTLDLNALLKRIAHAAADLCDAQAASILLYDEAKQELFFEVATNLEEPLRRRLIVPVEGSIAGWIVTHREAINISDPQNDPRHFRSISKATNIQTTSLLGAPMIAKNKVVGAIEAINKLQGQFTDEDEIVLVALAAQAAVAIENARLFQQSDLISELVHELRTPLTSLNAAAQLLHNPKTPEETRSRLSEVILGETNRLSEMTTAFLDLARIESGRAQFETQVIDVGGLLVECAELMQAKAGGKGVQIRLDLAPGLPPLKADRDKIKQVLLNLVSNAVKYNRPGGEVTLGAGTDEGRLVLQVRDTGPGIPAESLPHIFEKFYRVPGTERAVQGTGLGLSICKRIVTFHGGQLDVESQVGVGTTFTVRLPLPEAHPAEPAAP